MTQEQLNDLIFEADNARGEIEELLVKLTDEQWLASPQQFDVILQMAELVKKYRLIKESVHNLVIVHGLKNIPNWEVVDNKGKLLPESERPWSQ